MSRNAKWYSSATIAAGGAVLALNATKFTLANLWLVAVAACLGALAASMRTRLFQIVGPLAVNYMMLLMGLLFLSPGETVVLVGGVAAVSCTRYQMLFRRSGGVDWWTAAFDAGNMLVSTAAALQANQHYSWTGEQADLPTRLVLATISFYVVTRLLDGIRTILGGGSWTRKDFQDSFWELPYYPVGAIIASSLYTLKGSFGWQPLLPLVPLAFLIYRHWRLHLMRLDAETRHTREIDNLQMRTIEALAMAIEAKDQNSHDQLDQIQVVATAIGEAMHMDRQELSALRAASLLHDVGKLAVPEHIISKPGKLTREEFEKMKTHPLVGAQILERVKFPYPVVPIVKHHHEKYNGGGYPDGISGTQIPFGARILAVADAFVSLTSDRPHRPGITPDQALARISLESGISFDPGVVDCLKQSYLHLDRLAKERRSGRVKLTTDWNVAQEGSREPAKPEPKSSANFVASIAAARQEAQILFELAQELGNSLSLDETLSVFAVHLQRTIPYDTAAIFVRRDTILRPEYVSGENLRAFSALEIPIGHGISGWAAENRKPVLNGNPLMEPGYVEDLTRMRAMRSALALPLEGGSGVVGVLSLYSMEKDAFTRDHLRVLQAISTKVAMSIENALKYRQAESSAATDYLTGLYNARSLFLHLDGELARCRRLDSPLAILVSDLDGFKGVNDRFGHLEGNKLLQRVATKLKESCREYDCVARMGGDEFVVVLPGLSKDTVKALVPRLREKVREAGREVLHEDVIGFSVGEAYFPADGTDAEQLLAEADKRMYAFKSRTKMLKEQQRGFAFDDVAL